jgi:hypothetical protein
MAPPPLSESYAAEAKMLFNSTFVGGRYRYVCNLIHVSLFRQSNTVSSAFIRRPVYFIVAQLYLFIASL